MIGISNGAWPDETDCVENAQRNGYLGNPNGLGEDDQWEFWQDKADLYRWRRRSVDGQIMAISFRGLETEEACLHQAVQHGYPQKKEEKVENPEIPSQQKEMEQNICARVSPDPVAPHGHVARKKREKADELTKKYAAGLLVVEMIPLPVFALVVVPGFQVKLVKELADMYQTDSRGVRIKSLLAVITGVAVTASASRWVTNLWKAVPGPGLVISTLTSAAISATSTLAIGSLFSDHFETGGTLLSIDKEKMKTRYQEVVHSLAS